MNGFKKNKNHHNNGMSNKFGKGNGAQQQSPMKKEYGVSEKSSTKPNGMIQKSTSNNGMNKSTQSQTGAGSNKYFSSSEKKSSSNGKNMYKNTYKKCDDCTDIEPTNGKKSRGR